MEQDSIFSFEVTKNLKFYSYLLIEHENSVDGISANPSNSNEFVTGSHDKTIKVWDAAAGKSKLTLTGHS